MNIVSTPIHFFITLLTFFIHMKFFFYSNFFLHLEFWGDHPTKCVFSGKFLLWQQHVAGAVANVEVCGGGCHNSKHEVTITAARNAVVVVLVVVTVYCLWSLVGRCGLLLVDRCAKVAIFFIKDENFEMREKKKTFGFFFIYLFLGCCAKVQKEHTSAQSSVGENCCAKVQKEHTSAHRRVVWRMWTMGGN